MKKDADFKSAFVFWALCIAALSAVGAWQAQMQARAPRSAQNSPLVASGQVESGAVLSCAEVGERIDQFLGLHYSFRSFDQNLSERTYERLFEFLDPSRLYFLKQDVESFNQIRPQIHKLIKKQDCGFVADIRKVFENLVRERNDKILKLLQSKMDFEKDEMISTRNPEWASNVGELDERWRQRVKFQIINMMDLDDEQNVRSRLEKRYSLQTQTILNRDMDDYLDIFLNAFATALDPHSSHLLPEEQEDFNIRLGNRLEGIGATLSQEDGYVVVRSIVAGGAAEREGSLRVEDTILAVDPGGKESGFVDVIDMPLNKAVRLIRGPKGSVVKLLVMRKTENGRERLTIEITRDAIELTASRAKSGVLELGAKRVGVVRLPSFYTDFQCASKSVTSCSGAAGDVLKELRKVEAEKVDGVILDLRNNGGGDLRESILLTGLFIPSGSVVQTVDRRRISKSLADEDAKVYYGGPLVVFINKYSASASEIVAGALQDYGRALIVGDEHTFGKATVQIIQEIEGSQGRPSDGAIKVTQSKFYRPGGTSNQVAGVRADIVIPSLLMASEIGEREQKYALNQDMIRPASDFDPMGDLSSVVSILSSKSASRVASSTEFKELSDRISALKQQQDQGFVSLKAQQSEVKDAKEKSRNQDGEDEPAEMNQAFDARDFALKEAAQILVDMIEIGKAQASHDVDAQK